MADHRRDRRAALLLPFRPAGCRSAPPRRRPACRRRSPARIAAPARARRPADRHRSACAPARPAHVSGPVDAMSVMTFMLRSSSTSLEFRLALLVEGADAFAAVLGRHHPIVRLDLEHHAAGEVHVQPVVDRLLDLPRRDRRVAGDGGARSPAPRRSAFPAVQMRLTMPHSNACCAVNGLPVSRISLARRAPTARGRFCVPPAPGMMPSVTSVRAKRACLGGVDEVGAQRDLHAAGVGGAVHRGDDRHRAVDDGADGALEDQVLVLPLLHRSCRCAP